jgi:hypothetical protein
MRTRSQSPAPQSKKSSSQAKTGGEKVKRTGEGFYGLDMMAAIQASSSSEDDDASVSRWSENPTIHCINTQPKQTLNDDEEGACGWGSELSDSDLPQRGDEDDISSKGGVHSMLHELIGAIGNLSAPTHEILDDIWLKLPQVDGVNYPTQTNIPNVFDRQAELLKITIVLYENVSTVAMKNNCFPDDIYARPLGLEI